jgi:hypothetical protein
MINILPQLLLVLIFLSVAHRIWLTGRPSWSCGVQQTEVVSSQYEPWNLSTRNAANLYCFLQTNRAFSSCNWAIADENPVSVNFLAVASGSYISYLVPYIYFALRQNASYFVEAVVFEDEGYGIPLASFQLLWTLYPNRFIVRSPKASCWPRLKTHLVRNSVRFCEVPVTPSKYTYIGDVDIYLSDFSAVTYLQHSAYLGKPYSNSFRNTSLPRQEWRLTGLHFVISNDYYTPNFPSTVDKAISKVKSIGKSNDEIFLGYICEIGFGLSARSFCDSGRLTLDPGSPCYRPVFGYHLSHNRGVETGFNHSELSRQKMVHVIRGLYENSSFVPFVSKIPELAAVLLNMLHNHKSFADWVREL